MYKKPVYKRLESQDLDIENGHVSSPSNSHRKHRKSRCSTLKRCFGRGGCAFLIFFIGVKLVALGIIFFIGKEYIPLSLIKKMGVCDFPSDVTSHPPSLLTQTVSCKPEILQVVTPPDDSTVHTKEVSSRAASLAGDSLQEAKSNLIKSLPGIVSDVIKPYKPRIMCLIFTTPGSWRTKARAVNETWATRCDVHKFFYSSLDGQTIPDPDAIPMGVPEGRAHLTAKTMRAYRTAYYDYQDKIDWFLKADDDTYMIMENLRLLLSTFDPNKTHYVGGRSLDLLAHGYNGGGAGYALSRAAVQLVVEEGYKFPRGCKEDGGMEDLDMGACLEQFKIYPANTKDFQNRMTFHPDHPYKIFANLGDNRRVYTYNKTGIIHGYANGIRVMSPYMISFHYMEPGHMYMYDFLLYDLQRNHDLINPSELTQSKPVR